MFPHELVPDGNIMAPHHFYYFTILALVFLAAVWDNYRNEEPIVVAILILSSLFGFIFVWPRYPTSGAIISVGAPVLAIILVITGYYIWNDYPIKYRLGIAISLLLSLDDSVDHAFAFQTPLDYAWNNGLREYNVAIIALVGILIICYSVYRTMLGEK